MGSYFSMHLITQILQYLCMYITIQLAQEYMRIQTELALLDRRSEELQRQLEEEEDEEPNVNRFVEEYQQLMSENVSHILLSI